MFRRLVFEETAALYTIVAFITAASIYVTFAWRALRINALITLPFAPERFHILVFQRYGRVSGTDGTRVELRGIDRSQLGAIARHYWVRRIEPLQQGG